MADEVAAPRKRGAKGFLLLILVAGLAMAAGAALPWVLPRHLERSPVPQKTENARMKQEAIPFGDVVVNLGEDRLNRFLRVRIMVAVNESDVKEVSDLITKQKAFLKSWLIGHLSDQSSREVSRKVGVNRLRREIREHFNATLYPGGEDPIVDILFDEFVVQ